MSASSESWSQADIEALSITSSPMSTASLDLLAMPAPGPAPETVIDGPNMNPLDSESGTAQSRQRSRMLDAIDDGSFKRSKYYMSEEDIFTVVVEDTIFKLHAFFFKRESVRFCELLETHDKTSRLVLPDTKAEDLERFLELLYPNEIGLESYASKTADEWMSILRIAHRWDFRAIHKVALQHLEPVASPIDKIVCARTLGAADWLIGAYTALCTRAEPLTLDEGMRLGMAALHGRKDLLATEDILRVGLKEITCINDVREEIHRARKKGEETSALVEKKLKDHGLLLSAPDVDESPVSGAPGGLSEGAAEAKPSLQKARTASAVPVHDPVYKQPRLDIRDQSGQSILDGDLDSDIDWLLYGSQSHFKLQRINHKLIIADHHCYKSDPIAYFNGRQHSMSFHHRIGDVCDFIDRELKHGDVIAFSGDTAVSPVDGRIICLPDTGYIVCREDAPLGSAVWPTQMHTGQQQINEAINWVSSLDNTESTLASLGKQIAVDEICIHQGRVGDLELKVEKTKRQVRDVVTGLNGTINNLMCSAQLQARSPLQACAWSPSISDRGRVTIR